MASLDEENAASIQEVSASAEHVFASLEVMADSTGTVRRRTRGCADIPPGVSRRRYPQILTIVRVAVLNF